MLGMFAQAPVNYSFFPEGTVKTFTDALTGVLSANISVVLGIVAVVFAIGFARKMLNRGLRGKV